MGDDGRGPPVSRAGWLCWARPRRSACGWAVQEWSAGVGVKLGRGGVRCRAVVAPGPLVTRARVGCCVRAARCCWAADWPQAELGRKPVFYFPTLLMSFPISDNYTIYTLIPICIYKLPTCTHPKRGPLGV